MVAAIDQLLNERDPENDEGITPLHLAAEDGYDSVVRYLINQGRNVNARDSNEDTPLHMAAKTGRAAIVAFLAEMSALKRTKTSIAFICP